MEAKFSQHVKDVLTYSREEALRVGNEYIGVTPCPGYSQGW